MTGIWLVNTIVLWFLVIGLTLALLAMAKEVSQLHERFDSLQKFVTRGKQDGFHKTNSVNNPGEEQALEKKEYDRNISKI